MHRFIKNIFIIPFFLASNVLSSNSTSNLKEKETYVFEEVEKIVNILSGIKENKNVNFSKEIKNWIEKNVNTEIIIGRIFGKEFLKEEKKEIYQKIKDVLIDLTSSYCVMFSDQFFGYKIFGNKSNIKFQIMKDQKNIKIVKSFIPIKKIETKNKLISEKANVEITMVFDENKKKSTERSMIELKFFNDNISFSVIDFLIQKISSIIEKHTVNGKINIEEVLNDIKIKNN